MQQQPALSRRNRKKTIFYAVTFAACGLLLLAIGAIYIRGLSATAESGALTPLPKLEDPAIRWAFLTGPNGSSNPFLSWYPIEQLEDVAQRPIEAMHCTADRFLNLISAGEQLHIVTSMETNAKIRRYETSGHAVSIQTLLEHYPADFTLSEDFIDWTSNYNGQIYTVPHIRLTKNGTDLPGVTMYAHRDMMERNGIDSGSFSTWEGTVQALKMIRKNELDVIPVHIDFPSLQQMFGVGVENQQGEWRDPFLHPQTPEALQFLQQLHRERLQTISYSWSTDQIVEKLETESLFLVAADGLDAATALLPANSAVHGAYMCVGPVSVDAPSDPVFYANFSGKSPSSLFMNHGEYYDSFARLVLFFYGEAMELSPETRLLYEEEGLPVASTHNEILAQRCEASPLVAPYLSFAGEPLHYELLFSYYANTKLATLDEQLELYKQAQTLKMILSGSPGELEQLYEEACQVVLSEEYSLLMKWKEEQYLKAKELTAV